MGRIANKGRSAALVRHIYRSFEPVTARFFKQCSARMICWEKMGLLVGQGVFYSDGFKGDGFQLSGDDAECSVLGAFQLVQSGRGQPGLRGWGTEMRVSWTLRS